MEQVVREKLKRFSPSRQIPRNVEPAFPLPHSQEPTTCPYVIYVNKSTPDSPITFLEESF
jgi:hypothetical protein